MEDYNLFFDSHFVGHSKEPLQNLFLPLRLDKMTAKMHLTDKSNHDVLPWVTYKISKNPIFSVFSMAFSEIQPKLSVNHFSWFLDIQLSRNYKRLTFSSNSFNLAILWKFSVFGLFYNGSIMLFQMDLKVKQCMTMMFDDLKNVSIHNYHLFTPSSTPLLPSTPIHSLDLCYIILDSVIKKYRIFATKRYDNQFQQ